jgi:hypothetical protein
MSKLWGHLLSVCCLLASKIAPANPLHKTLAGLHKGERFFNPLAHPLRPSPPLSKHFEVKRKIVHHNMKNLEV